jgi:hypothetical protein
MKQIKLIDFIIIICTGLVALFLFQCEQLDLSNKTFREQLKVIGFVIGISWLAGGLVYFANWFFIRLLKFI